MRLILFTLIYVQLSVDHVTNNKDELARLASLGLDIQQILRNRRIGNQENTRSIGDYGVKGGYKDFDILRYVLLFHFQRFDVTVKKVNGLNPVVTEVCKCDRPAEGSYEKNTAV